MNQLALGAALPEIVLVAGASVLLLAATFGFSARLLHYSAIGVLVLCAAVVWTLFPGHVVSAYNGMLSVGPLAGMLSMAVLLACAGSLAYSADYLADRGMLCGEYHALALLSAAGMLLLVSAGHLITLYMGLEVMSLALYAMIAMRRDDTSAIEAAMKYFVLGALASGLILYGLSLVYGASGSLHIAQIAARIADAGPERRAVLAVGVVFVVAGAAFKLGAAPFHMWLPDVYHGAPTAVTLFIASAPKIAALALALRLLAETLAPLSAVWTEMLVIVSVASLAVGNITAIAQTNLKRMLAYSAISHTGFVLIGVIAGTREGYAGAVFYMFAYVLMTVGGFGMVALLARAGAEFDRLEDLRGLAKRNGLAAMLLFVLMLSMAGIPPMVGFYAKFAVLSAAVAAGWTWLAVTAVLFSVVGAFYYLRVVKLMFFDEPDAGAAQRVTLKIPAAALASANGALLLILGVAPGALMNACLEAVGASL